MASSCGKEYCPDTNCWKKHPLNKSKRERCERVKNCQNKICAPLAALGTSGFVLYDVCLQSCHLSPEDPTSPQKYDGYQDYLCSTYAPEDILEYYQVNPCNVDETQTSDYQQAQQTQAIQSSQATSNTWLIGGMAVVLLVAVFLLLKKK